MAYDFLLSRGTLSSGRTVYYAQLTNSSTPKFVIGYLTMYEGNTGLFNTTIDNNFVYNPADYFQQHGFWANFIYPTVMAESQGSYFCLNTYDRARFTFGFMQYAAHEPNGDFVCLLKKLLVLPHGIDYFPKLKFQNNRIFYVGQSGTLTQLEDDTSTSKLLDYLNPTPNDVENQELICAARMVHWASNDPEHRRVQVESAVDLYKNNMSSYDKRFGLNNVPAKVCQLICDIRHQGRGSNDRIASALNTNGDYEKAYKNLLTIGSANYSNRINTVCKTINSLSKQGVFNKTYDSVSGEFV